jgi:hypothetical protein
MGSVLLELLSLAASSPSQKLCRQPAMFIIKPCGTIKRTEF